jgi:hypothetical protein
MKCLHTSITGGNVQVNPDKVAIRQLAQIELEE